MNFTTLNLPLFYAEISVLNSPFPFVNKAYANSEEAAYRKAEFQARRCGLEPARRLLCHRIKPKEANGHD
jgi:hypothetical protein